MPNFTHKHDDIIVHSWLEVLIIYTHLLNLYTLFPCTQAWVRLEAAEHEREVALRKELMRDVGK